MFRVYLRGRSWRVHEAAGSRVWKKKQTIKSFSCGTFLFGSPLNQHTEASGVQVYAVQVHQFSSPGGLLKYITRRTKVDLTGFMYHWQGRSVLCTYNNTHISNVMYGHTCSKSMDQPGKVANPARG